MGIPLFYTPVEPEIASKSVEKTSARQRSSIRRTRPAGTPRMSPEARRRRLIGTTADFSEEYEVVELPTQRIAPPRNEDVLSMLHPSSSIGFRPGHEQTRMRLRDELFERRRTEALVGNGPLLPPAPESDDTRTTSEALRRVLPWDRENYSLVEARRRQGLRRLARRRTALTPPFTQGNSNRSTSSQRVEPEERRSILLPAPSSSRSGPMPSDETRGQESNPVNHVGRLRSEIIASRFGSLTADNELLAERVAALSRATDSFEGVSRRAEEVSLQAHQARMIEFQAIRRAQYARSVGLEVVADVAARRQARQTRLDGLGDRERSLSPEVAAWETLLSSITPDPQEPSAGSSFASSAAAAASSGPASAGTSLTSQDAVSVHESGDAIHDFCEASDSPTGDEDEDEDEDEYMSDQEYIQPAWTHDRLLARYAEGVLASQVARYNHSTDTEYSPWEGEGIQDLQQIVAGLSERDDVPDSWWASAGLSRNFRREPST